MTKSIRRCVLVAGVAALVSSQAAYAAPSVSGLDPLVSLAILGSDQSRAAVCAGASATTAAAAAAAAQAPPAGCVLPVTAPPPPPVAEAAPPPPLAPVAAPKAIGTWPILLGLAALAGIIALIVSSGHHHHGNVTPISPP